MVASPLGHAASSARTASPRAQAASPRPTALASLVASAAFRAVSRLSAEGTASPRASLASGSRGAAAVAASRTVASRATASRVAASRAAASASRTASAASRRTIASVAPVGRVASALGLTVSSYVPQLAQYPRMPLSGIDVEQLASAVLRVLADTRQNQAASGATPTRLLASAIARRVSSPSLHVTSRSLATVASRLASAVARQVGASAPLRSRDVDVGAAPEPDASTARS